MARILIFAPYSTLPGDTLVNRFCHLALHMASSGHSVTFVTSSFSHFEKRHRVQPELSIDNLEIVLLDEPGYATNVGLGRVWSLYRLMENFRRKFFDFDAYDMVYCAYPPIRQILDIQSKINRDCTRLVIDVQDVWPESFSSVIPIISQMPAKLVPLSHRANAAYRSAHGLVAVSNTYLQRARQANPTAPHLVSYIGSEFTEKVTIPQKDRALALFYVGTISHSYDVSTIAKATEELHCEGHQIEFHVYGSGPHLDQLYRNEFRSTILHGIVPYRALDKKLRTHHVAVNALAHGSPQTITNKLCDYMMLGSPVLNSQVGQEIGDVLRMTDHENYLAGDVESARLAILRLINSEVVYREWRPRTEFSRQKSSERILAFVEQLL